MHNYGTPRNVETEPGVGEFFSAHPGKGLNLPWTSGCFCMVSEED
jgi:hypothetical protein